MQNFVSFIKRTTFVLNNRIAVAIVLRTKKTTKIHNQPQETLVSVYV